MTKIHKHKIIYKMKISVSIKNFVFRQKMRRQEAQSTKVIYSFSCCIPNGIKNTVTSKSSLFKHALLFHRSVSDAQ